jgi:molybdenum cofactor cytidylyltransferase
LTSTSVIAAAVLAAGRSSRFPGDKLMHPLQGKPLAAHIAETVAGLDVAFRLAVCPVEFPDRARLFNSRGFTTITNADPARGMASSLALAAERASTLGADRLLICLADMPYVTGEHLAALLDLADDLPAATRIGERGGPPSAFPSRLFPALAGLSGDQGARELLAGARLLEAPDALTRDFDTLADFG